MHLKYTVSLCCSFPSPEPMPEGQRSDIPEALPPHSTKEDLDHHLEKQVQFLSQSVTECQSVCMYCIVVCCSEW